MFFLVILQYIVETYAFNLIIPLKRGLSYKPVPGTINNKYKDGNRTEGSYQEGRQLQPVV